MEKKKWTSKTTVYLSEDWHNLTKEGWLTFKVLNKSALMCKRIEKSNLIQISRRSNA